MSSPIEYFYPERQRVAPLLVFAAIMFTAPASAAQSSAAQASFQWPSVPAHVESYTTPEECLAATRRLQDSVVTNSETWRDTLPTSIAEVQAPLSAPAVAVARRCGMRFAEPSTSLDDFAPLLDLYLKAGRDSDATSLLTRRLKSITPNSPATRAAVLDTAAWTYIAASPPRLDAAERTATEIGASTSLPWEKRFDTIRWLMQTALGSGDSAMARRAATTVVSIVKGLTASERRTDAASNALSIAFWAEELLHGDGLLDSLRVSTAAYVALRRADWVKSTGQRASTLDLPIGHTAPAIEADYWFGRGTSTMERPSKNKVSLVVFLDHESCTANPNPCWEAIATVRRVAERFPELEITLVDQTRGYIAARDPLEPAAEADTVRLWWREKRHLPGVLAISKTDFWRLPEPDRRRIDRDTPNETHYSFGRLWPLGQFTYYLIDRSGTIVDVNKIERTQESHLVAYLNAVSGQRVAVQ